MAIKKRFAQLALVLAFLTLLLLEIAYADHNISYACPDECVANRAVVWQVNISNFGNSDINVIQLRIIDGINKKTIAETEKADTTISLAPEAEVNTTQMAIIEGGKSSIFTIKGSLPSPNDGTSLVYQFCHVVLNPIDSWGDIGPTTDYCFNENYTLEMLECTSNEGCGASQYCINSSCIDLNCAPSQYFEDHRCINYNCTSDNGCFLDEQCIQNQCMLLSCESKSTEDEESVAKGGGGQEGDDIFEDLADENLKKNDTLFEEENNKTAVKTKQKKYIVNHTCSAEPCQEGEIIISYECVKAGCADDEFIFEYSCSKLNCSYNEYISNHSCVKLGCAEDEGYANHSCVKLGCKGNQYIQGHSCKNLSCRIFEVAEEHECRINSNLIIQSALFAIIILLFLLDYKKYNSAYRKKLVSKLMKKAKERGRRNQPS